ncbi:hypothetical protein I7I51_01983 [Histoplasma capsulatum]|uniref:MADS-box domain-containing protein n=1 Tax=Ajellomyces capsulatus TaxID=5037 RepID=A0A8A1ME71_AJECA|nr:hypothetical protein I7I51_01983 [Histoplasma capsulatum]
MGQPQQAPENNQLGPFQRNGEPQSFFSCEDSIIHARDTSRRRKRSQSQQNQSNIQQSRRRRRLCLFHKAVKYAEQNEAQVYILIDIHGQFFILNTDSSETWPPSEEQICKQAHHYPVPIYETSKTYPKHVAGVYLSN